MENIDGGSVDTLVKNGALKETDAIKIIMEVGSALDYIHKQNVLHLDVKPSNILLRNNGEAVLIDFGISKRYDDEGGQTSTTPAGISKGYAPIEQYNQGLQNFSPATDVYSLGATLYKLLTGHTPMEAPRLLDDEEMPDCPTNISPNVWVAMEKAKEPRRKKRYQTIGDFLSDLSTRHNSNKTSHVSAVNTSTASNTPFVSSKPINSEETVVARTTSINNNEHQYVDLGLSVKWAKFNIGAKSEYEVGDLLPFATSQISNITTTICANKQYDHCYKAWGGDWRLPTKHEQDELRQQCQWEFLKDKKCYKVTGPSGNHILLPATEMVLGGTVGSY